MKSNASDLLNEKQPLAEFTEKAYLNYSMYVILDRALPHIADGLKPVQRRIVYAMSELGLRAGAKYKKSARTIGDVLGKYHPHSDTACYDAMVLMAQDFAYRYPLVDGQGNWGSMDDPKSFAAMRYTEARLTAYAQTLLQELPQGTVDWKANFDGTLEEPRLLPARLPNVLLNGATGIAVGMATDIPPHNVNEVVAACLHLLDHPTANIVDLCQFIQGPDFPTGGEIVSSPAEIIALYTEGYGSIRLRASYELDNDEIVITALPYQVSGAKIMEQIAEQMTAKKLPLITDLRDEGDHDNPTRLVITPRSNRVETDSLMAHLFATTDLERSLRVNLNMIGLSGRPQVKDLAELLKEWLQFRLATVTRRLQFRLQQVLARLHILAGLLITHLNIDEVIQIIRDSDDPKAALMQRFDLSHEQADAILDIKLRQLAKLEAIKIQREQEELAQERATLEKNLNSQSALKKLVRQELLMDQQTFGDVRRSQIVARPDAQILSLDEIQPAEAITVILSSKGWIRAAKGHDVQGADLNYRSGDSFLAQAEGRSNQLALFLDNQGQSYSLAAHSLPSARGLGEPLTSRLKPAAGAEFVSVLLGQTSDLYLIASDAGYGFTTSLDNLSSKNRSGKSLLKLPAGARALPPQPLVNLDQSLIAAVTNEGRLLIIPANTLPELPRGKGNKIIQIPPKRLAAREEFCVGIVTLMPKTELILFCGNRHLTLKSSDLPHFYGERGQRGQLLPRGFRRIDGCQVKTKIN